MTVPDLPPALRAALAADRRALAQRLDCRTAFVDAVLAGRRRPPDAMLAAVGWRRTVSYEPIPTEGDWWPSLTATEP